jgi:hypothetical protein
MTLSVGTRLGPYEIVSSIGAGGMSACGYAEPRTVDARRGIRVSSRGGWGPSATEKMLTPSPFRGRR